jgi:hypothetical protein
VLIVERLERLLLADRQALMTAAAVNGAENFEPLDVEERLDAFRTYLNSDPTAEDPAEVLVREMLEEVAE